MNSLDSAIAVHDPESDLGVDAVADNGSWYVVRCKPREDARAVEHLGNQGFSAFAPTCVVLRRVGSVRRKVVEPLFPGYAFVRLNSTRHDWSVMRSTRGVRWLVRFGTHTPRVPDALIARLRELDAVELGTSAARFKAGDRVRVTDGAFAGVEGVFSERDGELRACVLLELMQRQVRVTVASDALEPIR
jgi:transcriptional antiterminator RfaH